MEPGDYDEVASDPIAAAYLRPFVGSEELVNGRHRWCLWMTELDPLDLGRSAVLRARVEGVRQMRLKSKASSTKAMASTPHLFGQRSGGYKTAYLGIPRVVSENRPYYLAARLGPEVIPSDRLFTAPDPDGLLFGVISSTMFLTWQLTVGNRLESRPSFSNTLVWNNFPLPGLDHPTRAAIIAAGRRVQQVREAEGSSLASLYGSTLTSPLLESHAALDEAVDHAFSVENCSTLTVEDRQDVLIRTYMAMSSS